MLVAACNSSQTIWCQFVVVLTSITHNNETVPYLGSENSAVRLKNRRDEDHHQVKKSSAVTLFELQQRASMLKPLCQSTASTVIFTYYYMSSLQIQIYRAHNQEFHVKKVVTSWCMKKSGTSITPTPRYSPSVGGLTAIRD